MKLTKLQQLAEGANDATRAKIDKIITPLQDKVDAAYEAITFIRNQLQSDVLKDLLKEAGFPATETKMAVADAQKAFEAVRGLEEEINDLHMALGTHFEDALKEAVESSMSPEKEERIIRKVLSNRDLEDNLPHAARYKEWDTDHYIKTVDWITQESNALESKEAARTIAKAIRKAGVKGTGWTVRVVVRDFYHGDKTKWHAKIKV